jgi:hypothetical protein
MADRPILFSAPMVQALIAGRKTQTRRVLKPPYGTMEYCADRTWRPIYTKAFRGDRLWVREAVALVGTVDPQWVLYRADGYEAECARHGFDKPYPSEPRWRPSIHMPRWASRLTLTVTEVRVQRLKDISEADAVAEGCIMDPEPDEYGGHMPAEIAHENGGDIGWDNARDWFADLWESINGPDAWEANPWVVAISFTVQQGNIDALDLANGRAE